MTEPTTVTAPGRTPEPPTNRAGEVGPSRSEGVAAYLTDLAVDAEPGTRLGTKAALRDTCRVSVGTFNEGVKLAQSRGYLLARPGPGGGIFAAALSPVGRLHNSMRMLDDSATSVADAIRMRDALDPLLIQDVVRHSSATDVSRVRVPLDMIARALRDHDGEGFVRANLLLHARIAEVTPNAILRTVYSALLEIAAPAALAAVPDDGRLPREAHRRHELAAGLVDAIEARDEYAASRLVGEHNALVRGIAEN